MPLPLPKEIRSYNEAIAFLEELRKGELYLFTQGITDRAHFRGEENMSYHLQPKLCRYGHSLSDLTAIEPALMQEFKDALISAGLYEHIQVGYLNYPFHEEWLLYQQAQHLGVATRFLDWTLKFEVALFFACQSLTKTEGKVYVYFPKDAIFQADRLNDDYARFHPTQITKPIFLNPSSLADVNSMSKFAQRFKARQHGRFLVTPLSITMSDMRPSIEHDNLFHTVLIPEHAKADIMNGISQDGFTRNGLFLDDDPSVIQFKKTVAPIIDHLHKKYLE